MGKYLTKEEFNKLLRKIDKGEKHALETFYEIYGRFINSVAYSICKNKATADEIVNDVLVKVWNASSHMKVKNPESWLYVITANTTKSALKRKELPLNEHSIKIAAKDEIEEIISLDSFFSIISNLDEDEQEIFTYRFVRDMKLKDVATILGMSSNTVGSKLKRAINKLKQKINKNF